MKRARAVLLAAALAALLAPGVALAGQGRGPLPVASGLRVVVVVEDRVSFEQLLGTPPFDRLGATGGAGLMTTKTVGGRTPSSYLTIENGALTAPGSRRRALSGALRREGLSVCVAGDPVGRLPPPASVWGPPCRTAGAADRAGVLFVDGGRTLQADLLARAGLSAGPALDPTNALRREGRALANLLAADGAKTLVMVVSPSTSLAMDRVGDEVTPLVIGEGRGATALAGSGPVGALTSATTRTDGVVANVDVAPTILRWLGVPIPPSMDGEPITVTDGAAPFALHRLHLEQRRTRLPVALGIVAFIAAAGMAGIAVLLAMAKRGDVSPRVRSGMGFLTLAATSVLLVILGGGLLPHMTYPWVVPYVVVTTAALAWLAGRTKGGPLAPFVFLGLGALLFVVIDALFGGNAFRVPLYGSTIFDGARFYGISNTFIMLVVASALFVAVHVERPGGAALVFAAGLFMGFPRLGINVGGSIALFAAAGTWWAITAGRPRTWGNVLWGAAVTAGTTSMGLAIVLLANRYLPGTPTHATRFVERAGGDAGYGAHTVLRRLTVGFSQFGHVPAAWIPIVGLPIVLALVLWKPGPIGRGYTGVPRWRDATVTIILAAVVAYFANDTGVAAAAPAFLYAMAMMVYAALTWGRRTGPKETRALRTKEKIGT